MPYQSTYRPEAPERSEVDATPGLLLLEFGANWCGHCQAAQPAIQSVLAKHPDLDHRKIEDGPGRRLGRSFRVKLWPTLILLKDGQEVARVVRPSDAADLAVLFDGL
ncbi:MAG: thioredoxin [Gammaproteobacteria bacterium]|nr:MAG: thioredoxin [Gammaproteobacteria bacterium]